MGIIEEAAKRLEQLKQAGIAVPDALVHGTPARDRSPGTEERLDQPSNVVASLTLTQLLHSPAPAVLRPAAERIKRRPQPETVKTSKTIAIALEQLRRAGMVTPDAQRSKIADEFRIIKRPLIKNASGKSSTSLKNANLIMVTSALPGEGKSFVALNLAMSVAMERDSRVLLIDADVLAPTVPKLLGISAQKGLMDVLRSPQTDFGDVLYKTNVDRLSLVLAGTPHQSAAELLASEAMVKLLAEVGERYRDRIVIFDSPPLLATTEARALASHMGQVIVVVEAEKTTHSSLEQALMTVEACPVVMTVLNKTARPEVGSYYGYAGPVSDR